MWESMARALGLASKGVPQETGNRVPEPGPRVGSGTGSVCRGRVAGLAQTYTRGSIGPAFHAKLAKSPQVRRKWEESERLWAFLTLRSPKVQQQWRHLLLQQIPSLLRDCSHT